MGNYYTKWVKAVAISNQEAKTVARVLLGQFMCLFGAPAFIHTEQDRNSESSLFGELSTYRKPEPPTKDNQTDCMGPTPTAGHVSLQIDRPGHN